MEPADKNKTYEDGKVGPALVASLGDAAKLICAESWSRYTQHSGSRMKGEGMDPFCAMTPLFMSGFPSLRILSGKPSLRTDPIIPDPDPSENMNP